MSNPGNRLRLCLFAVLMLCHSYMYSQVKPGWVEAPGTAYIHNQNVHLNQQKLSEIKYQAIANAREYAMSLLRQSLYNTSPKPFHIWFTNGEIYADFNHVKPKVLDLMSRMQIRTEDLGIATFKINSRESETHWRVKIFQNMKQIEIDCIKRLKSDVAKMEKVIASIEKNENIPTTDSIEKLYFHMIVDITIMDVLKNMVPIAHTDIGDRPAYKLMKYAPPKNTPVPCVNAVTLLDEFVNKYKDKMNDWNPNYVYIGWANNDFRITFGDSPR